MSEPAHGIERGEIGQAVVWCECGYQAATRHVGPSAEIMLAEHLLDCPLEPDEPVEEQS